MTQKGRGWLVRITLNSTTRSVRASRMQRTSRRFFTPAAAFEGDDVELTTTGTKSVERALP
jgi:hypothetical protein